MADLSLIRTRIAENLGAITGLQVQPYFLSNPTPPAAHVIPGEVEYDKTMGRGHDDHVFRAQVFYPYTSDSGIQQKLDEHLAGEGARSVKAALEADETLGGACDDLWVPRASGYVRIKDEGQGDKLMCEWEVRVMA